MRAIDNLLHQFFIARVTAAQRSRKSQDALSQNRRGHPPSFDSFRCPCPFRLLDVLTLALARGSIVYVFSYGGLSYSMCAGLRLRIP